MYKISEFVQHRFKALFFGGYQVLLIKSNHQNNNNNNNNNNDNNKGGRIWLHFKTENLKLSNFFKKPVYFQ